MAEPRSGEDKYVERGRAALLALLEERGAVVWQEAVGRIAYQTDDSYPNVQYYPLSLARSELAREGLIIEIPRSKPQLVILQAATRPGGFNVREWERLPGARAREYLPHRRWVMDKPTTGTHAEHVLANSLAEFSSGRLLVRTTGVGNVTEINGVAIGHGQSLDVLAFATPTTIGMTAPELVPLGFECKNVYEWIYPWDHELWELLVKAARVAVQGVPVVPVLAAVRTGFTVTRMAQDVGFMLAWFQEQLVDPDRIDLDQYQAMREELGLAIVAHPRTNPHQGVEAFVQAATKEVRHPVTNVSTPVTFVRSDRFQQAAPAILRHAAIANGGIRKLHGDDLRSFAHDLKRAVGGTLVGGWF